MSREDPFGFPYKLKIRLAPLLKEILRCLMHEMIEDFDSAVNGGDFDPTHRMSSIPGSRSMGRIGFQVIEEIYRGSGTTGWDLPFS